MELERSLEILVPGEHHPGGVSAIIGAFVIHGYFAKGIPFADLPDRVFPGKIAQAVDAFALHHGLELFLKLVTRCGLHGLFPPVDAHRPDQAANPKLVKRLALRDYRNPVISLL